jgi:hypothetical protein
MKLFQKYALGMLLFATLFMTACEEDDPTVEIDPTLELTAGSEFDGAQLQPGDSINLSLDAMAGTYDLTSLVFFEDGVRLENWENRLFRDGQPASSNALALSGNDVDGFETDITILADSMDGDHDLAIEITDAESNTAEVSITYTTATYNIDTLMGVLFNQDGPADRGGLDLDEGLSTGTVNPDDSIAEVQDLGIDTDSLPEDNWIQKIAPYDDATMTYLGNEYDFASVTTQDGIIQAYNEGAVITQSDVVTEGDVFGVQDNGKYYLFHVVEVNITSDDNDDNYVLDIKKTD